MHSTVNCNDHVQEIKVKSKQIKTLNSVSAKEPLTERFGDSGYYAMIEFHFLTSFFFASICFQKRRLFFSREMITTAWENASGHFFAQADDVNIVFLNMLT